MSGFETYGLDTQLQRMKALQLVFDFHAVRNPGTHPELIEIELTDQGVTEQMLVPPPEAIFDTAVPPKLKAESIRDGYITVMKVLRRVNARASGEELAAYCQVQIEPYDIPLLGQGDDSEIWVADILPPPRVLRSMEHQYIERGRKRCLSLERFIDRYVA